MNRLFREFLDAIELTRTQKEDALVKYRGVCEKLYSKYYTGTYDEHCQYLFGSYKLKTNIRPILPTQDVDVIFKIPKEVFDRFDAYTSNGQEALLQDIKRCLEEKYTTTDKIKAWTKVVLVQFVENYHNVEVLPALEREDGTFLIPNTEKGGSWESFDPKSDVDRFFEHNERTKGLTRDLVKMIKAWSRMLNELTYKSYKIVSDVEEFLDNSLYSNGIEGLEYSNMVKSFFEYGSNHFQLSEELKNKFEQAVDICVNAKENEDKGNLKEASKYWKLLFGNSFPLGNDVCKEATEIINPARPWCI